MNQVPLLPAVGFVAGALLGTIVGIAAALAAVRGRDRRDDDRASRAARRLMIDDLSRVAGFLGNCLDALSPAQARQAAQWADVEPPLPAWRDHRELVSRQLDEEAWRLLITVVEEWSPLYESITTLPFPPDAWPRSHVEAMTAFQEEIVRARRALAADT
jgi:hypothetical protein